MNSLDVTPVGRVSTSTLESRAIRIVHISDTHLAHGSLFPPRPLSGNISIRKSQSSSSPNHVIDEIGVNPFQKRSSSRLKDADIEDDNDDVFHKGGVFLSNTRTRSISNPSEIPCGDVLVHSGDFDWTNQSGGFLRSHNFEEMVQQMNDFFDRFPHKVKIFVAGNHDLALNKKKVLAVQDRLISAVYLLNSSFSYEGINFYGAPFTPFRILTNARAFISTSGKIGEHWRSIPRCTDVLITHSPPHGILDLSPSKISRKMPRLSGALHRLVPSSTCNVCGVTHPGLEHWGCQTLREEVLIRVKPTLHLFGHVHEANGISFKDGITFSNAAYPVSKRLNVFDFFTGSFHDCTVRPEYQTRGSKACHTLQRPQSLLKKMQLSSSHFKNSSFLAMFQGATVSVVN